MSRSGYSDDCDGPELILWRGAVESAIRGRRGQAFLRETLVALDALPKKRLIAEEFVSQGECCALGAVAIKRGLDVEQLMLDLFEPSFGKRKHLANTFGIAGALVAEVMFVNDEDCWRVETPEERFARVREWVTEQIRG